MVLTVKRELGLFLGGKKKIKQWIVKSLLLAHYQKQDPKILIDMFIHTTPTHIYKGDALIK